ncbi:MAG TPA: S53 family peptidase, partial [Tepidisphaeraceae bacterium]|nr:S53 family peptidase [Tepidisphaeraceae bacterium]
MRPARRRASANTILETLERRQLMSAGLARSSIIKPTYADASANGSASPTSSMHTPAQIRTAYGFDKVNLNGIVGDGTGQTIAIIDAFDNPNFVNSTASNFNTSDLHKFDVQFGLPDPPSFKKVSQTGGTTLPAYDQGWSGEIALDVEWSHAIAPGAKIVLIEARSASTSNLMVTAANTARNMAGVSVVSMSFSGDESSSDPSTNSHFLTPTGHQGVTFVASTGDDGSPGGYPAYSPNVVAVGGTSLTLNSSSSAWVSEKGWNSGVDSKGVLSATGGGISTVEPQPSYQAGVVTQSTTHRTIPDIAFVADPATGVAVYDTANGGSATPWLQYGGTSLSAPAIAGMIAIA